MRELINTFGGRQSVKRKSRFEALWEQAMTDAADIADLSSDLDKLVARVESEIVPVERAVAAIIKQVLERQLDFSTRKSLRKWQRNELEHRIADLVSDLVSMDQLDPAMHERLAMRLAVAGGFQLTCNGGQSTADQLESFLESECADADEQRWNTPDPAHVHESTAPMSLDDSVFKRLFRQAAAALHPDKETDLDRLTLKHELMVQLLRARDERDLITLLQLHEQYADAESGLSSADESQLEAVLLEHLDVLRFQRESIIHQSYQYFMAYQRFYDRNPADTDAMIAGYLKTLKYSKTYLRDFICEVRTVKDLQKYLSQPDTSDHPGRRFFI